jgi:hypothetical protein
VRGRRNPRLLPASLICLIKHFFPEPTLLEDKGTIARLVQNELINWSTNDCLSQTPREPKSTCPDPREISSPDNFKCVEPTVMRSPRVKTPTAHRQNDVKTKARHPNIKVRRCNNPPRPRETREMKTAVPAISIIVIEEADTIRHLAAVRHDDSHNVTTVSLLLALIANDLATDLGLAPKISSQPQRSTRCPK